MRNAQITFWLIATLVSCVPMADAADLEIAATVDKRPVYQREVDRQLKRALGGRPLTAAAEDSLRDATLNQLIDRAIILCYLEEKNVAASEADLTSAMRRVERELAGQEMTLEQYLQRSKLSRDELKNALAWQIGWQRYLDRYLTDENLQRYFEQHRKDFDGTEVQVAHILLKVTGDNGKRTVDQAVAKVEEIRQRVDQGSLPFAEAAKQFSESPTGASGGQLGWIARRHPMPERFSQAAFSLDEGEISSPVVSPFGVHLILCQAIRPGQRSWQDARDELAAEVTRYLFRWVADSYRDKVTVVVK